MESYPCSESAAPGRWADNQIEDEEVSGGVPSVSCRRNVPHLRWSDMISDDECDCRCPPSPASTSVSESGRDSLADSEASETEDVTQAQNSESICLDSRFARPTRDDIVRQVRASVDELLHSDFDSVPEDKQSGLVQNMMVVLKSLSSADVYWTEAGERKEEGRYMLLGMQEKDMHVIEKIVQKAVKQCQTRSYRKAFDALCGIRPRFVPENLQAQQQTDDWQVAGDRWRYGKWRPKNADAFMDNSQRWDAHAQPATWFRRGGKRHGLGFTNENFQPKAAPTHRASANAATAARGGNAQCQFLIGIEEDRKFGVVRRILGTRGANMKSIASQTGSRLRLRGRGSGFLEGPAQLESTDPLMLCVSAPDTSAYQATKDLVSQLLEDIYQQYRHQCAKEGRANPKLRIQLHEGYRQGGR